MGTGMRGLGGVVLAAVLTAGLTGIPASAAPPDRDELRQAMTELARSGAAGVQLRVHDERGDWVGTRRLELSVTIGDVDPTDPQAAQRFFTAFNTVVTTAACGSPRPAANTALLNLAASSRSYPTAIDHPVVS